MTAAVIHRKFNSAIEFEKQGDYENALKEYNSIIFMDPTFRHAFYVNLGSLYSRMNLFSESMKCYEAALVLGRDYITYFNIGCILYKSAIIPVRCNISTCLFQ